MKTHPFLPLGYSVSGGRLIYNEEWDETAKWLADTEMKSNDLYFFAPCTYVPSNFEGTFGCLDPDLPAVTNLDPPNRAW